MKNPQQELGLMQEQVQSEVYQTIMNDVITKNTNLSFSTFLKISIINKIGC
jgi:hypothetical protein